MIAGVDAAAQLILAALVVLNESVEYDHVSEPAHRVTADIEVRLNAGPPSRYSVRSAISGSCCVALRAGT